MNVKDIFPIQSHVDAGSSSDLEGSWLGIACGMQFQTLLIAFILLPAFSRSVFATSSSNQIISNAARN
jgi:hypothetical protein